MYSIMAIKDKTSSKPVREATSGRYMGVKIAKPAVMPVKVSEASIREAVRSVLDERRSLKP